MHTQISFTKSYIDSIIRLPFLKNSLGIKLALLTWIFLLMITRQTSAQGNNLLFDGVNQMVVTPGNIPASGDFTVSVWAQHDASQAGGYVEILSQGTPGDAFYLGMETGGKIRVGDGWSTTPVTYPTDNAWHQLTVTKTASNAYLYLDGSLVATHGSTIPNPVAGEFRIARQYGVHLEYFKGSIDELSIWNRTLTATEVATVLNKTLTGNETGLIHCYNFNQSSGTNLPDITGVNHGTLYNSPAWVASTALTVDDLQATGTLINWYDAPSGGNLLGPTTLLVNGTHYYASQTVNGCESTQRLDVTATLQHVTAPTAGTHSPAQTQVVWNWNTVSGATGYKWGTTNVYAEATDMSTATTKTETSLSCNTAYNRYAWAYNASGCVSAFTTLTQTTSACVAAPWTFTNAGATGNTGPTQVQVNSAYTGSTLQGLVTINTQGIQEWTVPSTGTYRIDAFGAKGGDTYQVFRTGGNGSEIKGDFSLTAGEILKIVVGQIAANYAGIDQFQGGGGGGGSFVWKSAGSTLLIAAGGGGGAGSNQGTSYNGASGVVSNSGSASNGQFVSPGGTSGNGGGENTGDGGHGHGGSAGGGWLSDGASTLSYGEGGYSILYGNGIGGKNGSILSNNYGSDGGFGGGGGAVVAGGGGGGYSGGGAGNQPSSGGWIENGGGGGGSYNAGTNQTNTAGSNSSNGQVIITKL